MSGQGNLQQPSHDPNRSRSYHLRNRKQQGGETTIGGRGIQRPRTLQVDGSKAIGIRLRPRQAKPAVTLMVTGWADVGIATLEGLRGRQEL